MNCKHVLDLLPLFAGRDLDDKRAKLIAAHVQSCAACAASAAEYRESRQLLQQFAPPQFSEATYSGIRQRVLREISGESIPPARAQFFASLFRPRLRSAVAAAMLFAIVGFAFYFIASRMNEPQQVSHRGGKLNPAPGGSDANATPSPARKPNDEPTRITEGPHTGGVTISAGQPRSQRRKSSAPLGGGTSLAVNTPDGRSISAPVAPETNNLAEPNALPARDGAGAEKTLRVDMQTSDQNIRIIWFTHQRTKQLSPGKSSKRIQEARSYA